MLADADKMFTSDVSSVPRPNFEQTLYVHSRVQDIIDGAAHCFWGKLLLLLATSTHIGEIELNNIQYLHLMQ